MRFWVRTAFFAAVLAFCAANVPAWDETGHKITGYIAWQQMSPEARDQVIRILRASPEDADISVFYFPYGTRTEATRQREFFMLITTWADIIRDRDFPVRFKNYAHSNWHYADTFWTQKGGKVEFIDSDEKNGLAMDKLADFDRTIRSDASDADKAVAIAWLEHLIGDIHQPLHTSGKVTPSNPKGDQGGNLFLLTPKGTPRDKQENLHWFWDSIIGRNMPNSGDKCDMDYIDPIAEEIMKAYPYSKLQSRIDPGDFAQWQKESLDIATTEVYKGVKFFEMPSDQYKKKALKIAEERLALAGYRMAALFNDVFGSAKKTDK